MIEKAELTDNAMNQIVEVVKPILEEKDKEIERLNNILKMLKNKLDFAKRQEEEKLNRIERCMAYNNYILHESWYGGNEKKYAQRNIDILLGKETELKEIPRLGSDKE